MDLSVEKGKELEILKDLRELVKDHILPRLTQLENEVYLLRKITWPVCQSLTEDTQLHNINSKKSFLTYGTRDKEEILDLLTRKSKMSTKKVRFSDSNTIIEEYDRINR